MRTTVTIPEESLQRLMNSTGAASRNEAVNLAIAGYLAMEAQRQLLALRGQVSTLSNEEIEALDANEYPGNALTL